MAKGKPDDEVLKECREVHFPYELMMLAGTYERLKGRGSGICTNALIESFCVHARNLIDFYRGSGKNDFMKARFFTEDGTYKAKYVGPSDGEIGASLYAKLNQQVAHLTKERTSVSGEKIGTKDRETIFEALRKETAVFVSRLHPPPPTLINTGDGSPSATNAITAASFRLLGDDKEP